MLAVIALGIAGWMAWLQHVQKLAQLQGELDTVRREAARSRNEITELKEVLNHSDAQAAQLTQKLASSQSQIADLTGKLASSQSRVSELEKEKESVTQKHKGLEAEMRAELESKDVTISELQGKLTVNILDRILFDSGEAVLKAPGEAVLQKIAGILAQHPALNIHVIGHTDNVPIRASARSRFPSNWELSTARALAAVRFLTEKAGVDPRRLGAVGYGEFRPLADNSTPEGRAQNRRIAISILADELAGADTAPTVTTNTPPAAALSDAEPDKDN
jgi:chemotaxis protein MotB